ncbi:hypothetical protein BG011_008451 [Mortierella polycephala]|uniref:Uncharacterized protein n=1 Tax=Mortierella polycephala TaxID=41804 RepID=A0A9P6UB06_9FUNG|nr:hypothetical protein BG011_008451 [Mortierella polycephala]
MEHNTPVYYENHRNDYDQLVVDEDEDEEYREDLFLKHYNRPRLGGLGLIHDDDDSETGDDYSNHHSRVGYQDDDDDDDEELDDDDDYDEVDMDQHGIQLLSGSLSVRSPFLDAIREEEGEEAVFTKPSSYPSLGSGRYLNRLSGEGVGSWANRSSLGMAMAEKLRPQQQQEAYDQQQANFNNTNQSDGSKPRGPRPQIVPGRPRSNTSSLTKVTTGFDISPSSTFAQDQDASEKAKKDEHTLRQSQVSPESTMQDLEVKRVLEGATALASPSASSSRGEINNSAESTPLPSTAGVNSNAHTISLSSSARDGNAASPDGRDPVVSFGHDTQKSIDDFFGMVKSDLDKRIQEAIQEVEQKFLDRVQRLEKHTAALAGVPPDADFSPESASTSGGPKPGSLMESLTRPLPAHQNPGGSIALRKEILSHVTDKVGDLDLRVNQMEVLVSYKLVDIESKVRDLHGAHNSIAQKVHQVAKSHKSNMQGVRAGDGVGQNTIDAEEVRISAAMQPYRDIDARGNGASAFLEPIDDDDEGEGVVSLRARNGGKTSTDLVDTSSAIVELRTELQDLGMRYQELNDGLLTDLMGQMRDAKLMLFQTVDEVDGRISKRVDRIEADMHSKLLSEIEGRVQERVRAMEQTSSRLEKCFDKMEGRLGALETVLASRRPRPESMYQLLQQQIQQQQQQDEENGISPHAGTFAGFPSSPSSGHRSVTSMLFSEADSKPSETASQHTRPRRRTLAENGIYPDSTQLSRQDSYDGSLMMLETDSTRSTLKSSSPPSNKGHSNYNHSAMAMIASPLEGFVTPAQVRPVWSPSRGVPTTAISPTSASTTSMVSSPLERGTVIGDRMGTIHQEYTPRTCYVSSTPTKDKFSSGSSITSSGKGSDGQGSTGPASRIRRVSLSSFDANSLSALKPVRPSTAAAAAEKPASTSIVTTMTTMTTMTTQHDNNNDSHGNISVKSSSSSLLTAELNGSNGSGSSSSTTKTMQRAMTFDTLHSQASATSTITKTVKVPVQGPSSYRELLHFWKAGGSGNSSSKSAAV